MPSHLTRVSTAIQGYILEFAAKRKSIGKPDFHMQELTDYVSNFCEVAPDSPGRIMRMLKKSGALDYTLVSRSKSFYRFH